MNPDHPPMSAEQIEEAALALPEAELELLVERLEARLPVPQEVDRAWRGEVARRVQRLRAGAGILHDAGDVLAELELDA